MQVMLYFCEMLSSFGADFLLMSHFFAAKFSVRLMGTATVGGEAIIGT
jgi:hypothetical protein